VNRTLEASTPRQLAYYGRLTEAKDRLLRSVAGLDQAVLCGEPVFGDWTARDLIGHVVSWNDELRAEIEQIRQGRHPGYANRISGENDFDEWNQARIAEKRDWAWDRLIADVDRDYAEAVELIMRLRPQDWRKRGVAPWQPAALDRPALPTVSDTVSVETLMTYHWRHANAHARDIEKWRKRRGL
jgi:hypothetical protein